MEMRYARSMVELIGNTPLVKLSAVTAGLEPLVLAKVEYFNPGGSVKDRIALRMIEAAEKSGELRPGGTIVEPTSGNTGVGLAIVAQTRGYRCVFVCPDKVSTDKINVLRAYGAEVVVCPTAVPPEHPESYYNVSDRLVREIEGAWKPNQYVNPNNPLSHYESTGPELWAQTGGRITHFVAGIGTGGTIMGTGRYLKEVNPRIQVIAVEPDDALHGLEGLKHMASSIVPGIYHEDELDAKMPVSTEDAYTMVYRLSQEEGVLVGQSSGAAMFAAMKLARKLRTGTIVTIFPDFGDKYLTTNLWVGWRDRMTVGNLEFSI